MFPDVFGRCMEIQLCRVWGKRNLNSKKKQLWKIAAKGQNYKSRSGKRGGQRFLETQKDATPRETMAASAKPEAKEMMRDGKQVWRQSHYFVSVFSTRMRKARD